MKKSIKPRKEPKQSRSRRTREEILQATTHLLNRHPLGEVSTNHIARKTGISIGTLYKYYPNRDSILADLSLMYMRQDAERFEHVFAKCADRGLDELLNELVETLMQTHKEDSRVRGVVYQNLERLKLVTEAQNATQRIHAKGNLAVPRFDPALTWVALSAVNSAVHSMSQLSRQEQNWRFVQNVCRQVIDLLMQSAL